MSGATAALWPIDPLEAHNLSGGEDTYAEQPPTLHIPREFPPDIPRALPEPFMR